MLFTLCYLGFEPRIASETLNSADNRIDKICALIRSTDFSIHDMSRCVSASANEYYRLNMPFELGIDYGNAYFHPNGKKLLILEGKRFDFQKAMSDLSGVDVKCHSNEPADMVKCVRNWMVEAGSIKDADSPTQIWYRFTDFASDFYDERKAKGFTDEELNDTPTPEYIRDIKKWLTNQGFAPPT